MVSDKNAYNLTSSADLVTVRQDQPYHHQLPPYGIQGAPFVIAKHKLLYPSRGFKMKWSLFERKRLTEQLNKCFPPIYVLAHAICLGLHALIMIGLQIALMVENGALANVGAGIWGGIFFLVIAGVTIFLVWNRKYWILIASYILHVIGLLVAISAYLIVNIIGIGLYTDNCLAVAICYNSNVKAISYIMFWLGVVIVIMVLVYLILMPIYIMDACHQPSKYKEHTIKVESQDDFLQHSSLYAQNNLNPDGTVKVQNILSVKSNLYEYRVQPVDSYRY